MKKKIILSLITIVSISLGILIGSGFNKEEASFDDDTSSSKHIVNEQTLSMMIEQTAGAGDYKMETRTSWPTDGYMFNATLSKCENGGELGWDSEKGVVTMTGNMSDKCYVYFDKEYIKLALNDYTFSWNAIDGASAYQIYSDGELLTTTTNTSIELWKLYEDSGTYKITAKALDSSSNAFLDSNTISYNLEKIESPNGYKIGNFTAFGRTGMDGYYYIFDGSVSNSTNVINDEYIIWYFDLEKYLSSINISSYHDNVWKAYVCNGTFEIPIDFCNNYSQCMSSTPSSFSINQGNFTINYNLTSGSFNVSIHDEAVTSYIIYGVQFSKLGLISSDWVFIAEFSTCLSSNTEVYVYDKKKKKFKKKKIGDIDYDDEILCWNFDKGEFAIAKPIWIKKCEQTNKYNLLKFSDGSTLETINQHRIFNVEKGMFTYPMTDDTPIGTTTFNSKGEYVKLVSKEVVEKPIDYYNVMTEYHINLFANDILTSSRLSNMYKIKNMKYVYEEKRNNRYDLSKYDEKFVKGLRLKEQNVEETKLKAYVDNMLKLIKK